MAHPPFDFSHLSPAERAQLAVELWDSIAREHEDDLPVPAAHRATVARRHAAFLKDPGGGTPWEKVKSRLVARVAPRRPKKRPAKRRSRP
jgi:putative addiction module component (TIGR02574 family)